MRADLNSPALISCQSTFVTLRTYATGESVVDKYGHVMLASKAKSLSATAWDSNGWQKSRNDCLAHGKAVRERRVRRSRHSRRVCLGVLVRASRWRSHRFQARRVAGIRRESQGRRLRRSRPARSQALCLVAKPDHDSAGESYRRRSAQGEPEWSGAGASPDE